MKSTVNREIGERLQRIRKMLGVTGGELSEKLGISVGYYRKLERGEHMINMSVLKCLHDRYGIDLNYLITGRGREEDLARDLASGRPEEVFYFLRLLLDSCERMYMMNVPEEEGAENEEYYSKRV